jgi:hypothetical protein
VFERPRVCPLPLPPVPPADFWLRHMEKVSGGRLPVSELAVVRELAGPPPAVVRPVDWAGVHARLGFSLPADYRALFDSYGPGHLSTLNPAGRSAAGRPPTVTSSAGHPYGMILICGPWPRSQASVQPPPRVKPAALRVRDWRFAAAGSSHEAVQLR